MLSDVSGSSFEPGQEISKHRPPELPDSSKPVPRHTDFVETLVQEAGLEQEQRPAAEQELLEVELPEAESPAVELRLAAAECLAEHLAAAEPLVARLAVEQYRVLMES